MEDQCVCMFFEISPVKIRVFVNNKELVLKQCCIKLYRAENKENIALIFI